MTYNSENSLHTRLNSTMRYGITEKDEKYIRKMIRKNPVIKVVY